MATIQKNQTKIQEITAQQVKSKDSTEIQKTNLTFSLTNPKVTVCVRKRPIEASKDVIEIENNTIIVHNNKLSYSLNDILCSHKFQFDKVYNGESTNNEIFKNSIENMVDYTLNGGCSTVVAYGQTGTGKTHSLLEPYSGIIFESVKHILKKGYKGSISFLEIYLGHVQDCLKNKSKLNIFEKEGCIYASDLTSISFDTFEEACALISTGLSNRTTSHTDGNSYSSRSHAILFIDTYKGKSDKIRVGPRQLASNSTFVLVDLAGSERGTDRKSCTKESAAEGAEINKSLLALKECIRGIEMNSKFLPFRQSKLTQLLKNSFIGESKLFFLATISASGKDAEHTLNTLRYAIRIKDSKFYTPENNELDGAINNELGVYEEKLIGETIKVETLINENFTSGSRLANKAKLFEEIKSNSNDSQKTKLKKEINTMPLAAKSCIKKPSSDLNDVDSTRSEHSSSILTSEEIRRLKDLSLANSSLESKNRQIRESANEISRIAESLNDPITIERISQDLKLILSKLKNSN